MKTTVDNFRASVYMHNMGSNMDLSSMRNCVCFNLRRASRVITQFYDAELRRHGIRPTQTPVLTTLAAKPAWGMEELSGFLGLERTTLVRNLRPLERDGLVKVEGGGHGNRVAVSLTQKGKKELEKVQSAWHSAQRAIVQTLGEQRWSAILSDLERATTALDKS
jgi:DNA-binding MarR family transcriptional regulator